MKNPIIRAKKIESLSKDDGDKKVGVLIALVGVIVASGAAWWFLVRPVRMRVNELKERTLPELEIQKSRVEGFYYKAKRVDEQLKRISASDRATLEAALPSIFDTPDIIENIESLVKLSGLSVDLIGVVLLPASTGEGEVDAVDRLPPTVRKAVITVRVNGINYLTFKEFLGRIETNSRLLDLTALSFSPDSDAMQVELTSYSYSSPWKKIDL